MKYQPPQELPQQLFVLLLTAEQAIRRAPKN